MLENSSPIVSAGLCSPQGEFGISFWIFIPSEIDSVQWSETNRIHLISRVPETGDLNMVELVHGDPNKLETYTFSMHLLKQDDSFVLEVFLITYTIEKIESGSTKPTAPSRKRIMKRSTIKSLPIETNRWNNCFFEAIQSKGGDPEKLDLDLLDINSFNTFVNIQVNSTEHVQHSIEGGLWPLHQNIIVGKLPLSLGISNCEEEKPFIKLADVIWIPTSCSRTPKSSDLSSSFCTAFPSTEIVETINALFRGACVITKVIDSIVHVSAIPDADRKHLSPNLSNNIAKLFKILQNLLLVGCRNTQRVAMQLIRRLVANFHELYTNSNAFIASSAETYLEGSPLTPAGSARIVAMRNKPPQATFSTLRLLIDILSSLLNSKYCTFSNFVGIEKESNNELSNMSNFRNLQKIWDRRLYLNRINVENYMNITTWISNYCIEENALFQDISGIFSVIFTNWKVDLDLIVQELFTDDSYDILSSKKGNISRQTFNLIYLSCLGGWFPLIKSGAIVDIIPRRSQLLYHNKLPIDQIALSN